MPTADPQHLDAIRLAKQRRLEALEIQAATFGSETPPHISTEIADLKKEITGVEAVTNPTISKEVMDALQNYGQLRAILATVMGLVADVRDLKEWRETDHQERVSRQHRTDMLFLALFLSMAFVAVIVLVR